MSRFLTTVGLLGVVLSGMIGMTRVEAQDEGPLAEIGQELDGILRKLDERGAAGERVPALRDAQAGLEALLARTRELYGGASDRGGERERVEFHLRYLIRWTRYLLKKSGTAGETEDPLSGAEVAYRRGIELLEAARRHGHEQPADRVGIAERYLAALALLRGRPEERMVLAQLNALWAELDDGSVGEAGAPSPVDGPKTAEPDTPRAKTGVAAAPGKKPTPTPPSRPVAKVARKYSVEELKQVRERLARGTPAERIEAGRVLATLDQSWVGRLLVRQLAREDDAAAREALSKYVLEVGDRHVVKALGKWSRSGDAARRQEAIELLGKIPRKDVGQALSEFSNDSDIGVIRKVIGTAKGLPKGYGVAALARIGKARPAFRFEVIEALGQTGHADAARVLISFLHRRRFGEYKDPAVKALRVLGPAAIPPLIDALDGRDYRQYAADALRSVTGERFGMSRSRWVQWWRKNRGRFEKASDK